MSAIYHPVFHQVVSADNQANLYIWDADTGNLVLRIPSAHPNTLISCMCFDDLGRRFITGAADGSISMWNISNGQKIAVSDVFSNRIESPEISLEFFH